MLSDPHLLAHGLVERGRVDFGLRVDLLVEERKEQLALVDDARIRTARLDERLNEVIRQWLLILKASRHAHQRVALPRPVFKHLRSKQKDRGERRR